MAAPAVEGGFPQRTNNTTTVNTITSGTFTTGAASVLIVIGQWNGGTDGVTPLVITDSGFSKSIAWTLIGGGNAWNGQGFGAVMWYCVTSAALTNQTVTWTTSNAGTTTRQAIEIYSITGANLASPLGGTASALSAGNSILPQVTLGMQRNNGLFVGAFVNWNLDQAITALAGTTTDYNADLNGASTMYAHGTPGAGTVLVGGSDTGGTVTVAIAAEIQSVETAAPMFGFIGPDVMVYED
jgi:hypothetical protein